MATFRSPGIDSRGRSARRAAAVSGPTLRMQFVDSTRVSAGGVFARVGATEERRITTAAEGVQLLCVGATPGQVYTPLAIVELGGPTSF